jgi:zinc protease
MHVKTLAVFSSLILLLISQSITANTKIEHWQTQQGGQVYYVYSQGLPLADVRLVFDAGSARDDQQFGLALLTSTLLDTGAGNWNADTIAQRFESIGATFSAGISTDMSWLALRSLTREDLFAKAISTMSTIVAQPKFSESDFGREKKRVLASLKHREESPSSLARIAFNKALYGSHPYSHPSSGFIGSIDKISADNLKDFHQQFYVAANATVVIVGDLNRTQAEAVAEQLLSGLAKGQKPEPLPYVTIPSSGKTQHIEFPSAQTHVLSGMPGIDRKDQDYFPLVVGNHILGGSGLVSKIFGEVREKRGLAYSAYSYFSPKTRKGPFTMGLQTKNDQAQEALKVLSQTLVDFIEQGPTEAELEAAKKNITGGFAMRFDTNKKLTEYVAMIAFNQLPLDYLDNYPKQVMTVSKDAIKEAFQRRIQPALLQTITVGKQQSPSE